MAEVKREGIRTFKGRHKGRGVWIYYVSPEVGNYHAIVPSKIL